MNAPTTNSSSQNKPRGRGWGLVIALVLLVIFVAVAGVVMWRREEARFAKAQADAEIQRRKVVAELAAAKDDLAQSQATSARKALAAGDVAGAAVLFARSNATAPNNYARWSALRLLDRLAHPAAVAPRQVAAPQPEQPVRLSDDGKFLGVVDGMGIFIYAADRDAAATQPDQPIHVDLTYGSPPFDVAFAGSPATLRVLHGVPSGIEIIGFDPRTGKRRLSHQVMGNMARIAGWSVDLGRAWVIENGAKPGSLAIVSTADAKDAVRADLPAEVVNVVFSSDDSRVAATCGDKKLRVLDAGTLKMIREFAPAEAEGPIRCVALSRGGRFVAWVQKDRRVHIQDAASGADVMPPVQCDSEVRDIAFEPSGRWLFVHGQDKTCIVDAQRPQAPGRWLAGAADGLDGRERVIQIFAARLGSG